jgi:folate-binding protein YgfZ
VLHIDRKEPQHGAAPRYWAFGAKTQIETALQSLPWIEDGLPMWQLSEVEAGIPRVLPPTSEAFLPQNLNLEALGALSFSKGCYPGQEVIARTQHLGTVKRRLMRGRSEAVDVEPGTPLKAVHDGADQDGGKVLYAAEQLLLAVIPLELFETDACFYTESDARVAVKNWERL